MTTRLDILERKRKKAADLAAAALAAEANANKQVEGVETLAIDQGEKSLVVTPPTSSPPREPVPEGTPVEPKKRPRSENTELKVYSPQWSVLDTDRIIVPAPSSSKNVGPDLCRGLVLPADRPTVSKLNNVEACTEMMTLLSMVSFFSFVRTYLP